MDIEGPSNPPTSKAASNGPVSAPKSRPGTPGVKQHLKASSVESSRIFAPNASIVLAGVRGCGKTSLGYIAARALDRRLVEADDELERKSGCSRAQFLNNGEDAEIYRMQERKVMESMLVKNE